MGMMVMVVCERTGATGSHGMLLGSWDGRPLLRSFGEAGWSLEICSFPVLPKVKTYRVLHCDNLVDIHCRTTRLDGGVLLAIIFELMA